MKWAYGIRNKLAASGVLLGLCLLVLLNNYLERSYAQNVKDSISTLYKDRLIAEDYILKMTRNVYEIRQILGSDAPSAKKSAQIGAQLALFTQTYDAYVKTKFTQAETNALNGLMGTVRQFETAFLQSGYMPSELTERALFYLDKLATVQLEESKSIMEQVESQHASIKATSQFAFAIIIIILIVLQIIVFSSASLVPAVRPKDPRLN